MMTQQELYTLKGFLETLYQSNATLIGERQRMLDSVRTAIHYQQQYFTLKSENNVLMEQNIQLMEEVSKLAGKKKEEVLEYW